jgi:hypothetical protein
LSGMVRIQVIKKLSPAGEFAVEFQPVTLH